VALAYAAAEAEALLNAQLGVVKALVDAIVEKGTLSGAEVDAIIMQAMAAETLALEHQRRTAWKRVQEAAALFPSMSLSAG
jgi:hypothetical protein